MNLVKILIVTVKGLADVYLMYFGILRNEGLQLTVTKMKLTIT